MNCSFPPPLNDDEIAMALDGVADESIEQHLAQCLYCRTQLEEARKATNDFELRLKSVVFRLECPPSSNFVDLFFERLTPAENAEISQHLKTCPHCQKDFGALKQFMKTKQPLSEHKVQRKSRFGELVAALLEPQASLAAGFRGDSGNFVFEAAGTTIFLTLQQQPTGHYLSGQVLASDDVSNWSGALVELRQNTELKATSLIDEKGRFMCPLTLGEPIELRITNNQSQSILVKGIELKE